MLINEGNNESGEINADAEIPAKTPESEGSLDLVELAVKHAAERETEDQDQESDDPGDTGKSESESKGGEAEETDDSTNADAETESEGNESETDTADLKAEDVDTVHEKDSPTARKRIKALAQIRDELKSELDKANAQIDLIGGEDGLNDILGKIEILENPEKGDEFLALVESSPNFKTFKDKHFWDELDKPATQELVVQDRFGEGYTLQRLEKLVELDQKGLIDIESLELGELDFLDDDAKQRRQTEIEKYRKLEAENEDLKKKLQSEDGSDRAAKVAERQQAFVAEYDGELFPMLQEFGVLELPDDPEPVREAKARSWQKIVMDAQTEFESMPAYKEIARMIEADQMNTTTFRHKQRAFKTIFLETAKKAVTKELPFLTAVIKGIFNDKSEQPNTAETEVEKNEAPERVKQLAQEAPKPVARPDLTKDDDRADAFERAMQKSAAQRR